MCPIFLLKFLARLFSKSDRNSFYLLALFETQLQQQQSYLACGLLPAPMRPIISTHIAIEQCLLTNQPFLKPYKILLFASTAYKIKFAEHIVLSFPDYIITCFI